MKHTILIALCLCATFVKGVAQNITIEGVVSKNITVPKITFDGTAIQLNNTTLICDVLEINGNVTKLQITGNVKIICRQILNAIAPLITLTNSKGSLTIVKPQNQSNLNFKFLNSQQLEIKSMDSE